MLCDQKCVIRNSCLLSCDIFALYQYLINIFSTRFLLAGMLLLNASATGHCLLLPLAIKKHNLRK